jgi:hypothetical protein
MRPIRLLFTLVPACLPTTHYPGGGRHFGQTPPPEQKFQIFCCFFFFGQPPGVCLKAKGQQLEEMRLDDRRQLEPGRLAERWGLALTPACRRKGRRKGAEPGQVLLGQRDARLAGRSIELGQGSRWATRSGGHKLNEGLWGPLTAAALPE